jgi:hypothetical protein
MTNGPIVVLGFQFGRAGTGTELAQINAELAEALRPGDGPTLAGLLRYQVLQHATDPDRFCAYWLWKEHGDRDATWRDPPDALRRFWAHSGPLWRREPSVARYVWRPAALRDLCPSTARVGLERHAAMPVASDATGEWLLPTSSDVTPIRVRVADGEPADPGHEDLWGPCISHVTKGRR